MDIQTAKSASTLAAQIEIVQNLLDMIDIAIAEKWLLTVMKATAPASGASLPSGTVIDLLPTGAANDENSQMGLAQARATYSDQLSLLTEQLNNL